MGENETDMNLNTKAILLGKSQVINNSKITDSEKCARCGEILEDKHKKYCKPCAKKEYQKKYYRNRKKKDPTWRQNPEWKKRQQDYQKKYCRDRKKRKKNDPIFNEEWKKKGREYMRNYYKRQTKEQKEKRKEYDKKYYQEHKINEEWKKKRREDMRNYYQKHKEYKREYSKKYRQFHKNKKKIKKNIVKIIADFIGNIRFNH